MDIIRSIFLVACVAAPAWAADPATMPSVEMSWFGNSFSGNDAWMQRQILDCVVLPDGTLVAISFWDERHKEIGFYKDGKAIGRPISGGGGAIATDGEFLYAATTTTDGKRPAIRRLRLDGQPAPWDHEVAFEDPGQSSLVYGLAAGNGELYAAATTKNEVRVFELKTGAFKRAFEIPKVERIAFDPRGRLWIGPAEYDTSGKPTGRKIEGVSVGGMSIDLQGRLLIADKGKRHQVIIYDISGDGAPKEIGTIGAPGGAFAPPRGMMGEDRLLHPSGVGADAAGNIYVTSSDLTRCYGPDGKLRWQLESTMFIDCADFDPGTDGNDIYSGNHHYRYVPNRPAGEDWQWVGYTTDAERFPELSSGNFEVFMRRIDGQLFRYSIGEEVLVHRKEKDSEIFIPAATYSRRGAHSSWQKRPKAAPEKGRYFWCDVNGNGLVEADECTTIAAPWRLTYTVWIDERGDIWEPQAPEGILHFPLKSINEHGVPVYDAASPEYVPLPKEFTDVLRLMYYPSTDTMVFGGYTPENPPLGTEHWGSVGREIIIYDHWSDEPRRSIRSRMVIPKEAVSIRAMTFAPRAGLVFAGQMETMKIFTFDAADGALLGVIAPDKTQIGPVGWLDLMTGLRAFDRENGEVLLIQEEVFSEKQLVYRLRR